MCFIAEQHTPLIPTLWVRGINGLGSLEWYSAGVLTDGSTLDHEYDTEDEKNSVHWVAVIQSNEHPAHQLAIRSDDVEVNSTSCACP